MEDRLSRMWGRTPFAAAGEVEEWSVPLDMREQDGQVIVEASVPGIKPEDIDVSVEDGTLTIKGETKSETEEKKEGYLLKERRAGSFYRSVRLPESVDPAKATSSYADGVLRVTMPKKPEKQAKKIKVEVQ
jgi:HSP20 family protein